MAYRRPAVMIDGVATELPSNDILTCANSANGEAFGANSGAIYTDSVAIGRGAITTSGTRGTAIGPEANAGNLAIAIGYQATAATGGIAIGAGANAYVEGVAIYGEAGLGQFVVGGSNATFAEVVFGNGLSSASPTSYFKLRGTDATGNNIEGSDVIVAPGKSTGTAPAGRVFLQGSTPVTGGGAGPAVAHTLSDVVTIAGTSTTVAGTLAVGGVTTLSGNLVVGGVSTSRVREVLSANRTYYVRTNGSDSNDGSANDSGHAFQTLAKAVETVAKLDRSIYDVTVNVAAGTYTSSLVISGWGPGTGNVLFQGDTTTPANVIISTSADAVSVDGPNSKVSLGGFKLVSSSASCLRANGGAPVLISGKMEFGAANESHVTCTVQARVEFAANYAVSGGVTNAAHWNLARGGVVIASSRTITFSNSPNFPYAFASLGGLSYLECYGMTFTNGNTVTGRRFEVGGNSVIFTAGASFTYLPGDANGATPSGGQYN